MCSSDLLPDVDEASGWANDWDGEVHATTDAGWAEVAKARAAGYEKATLAALRLMEITEESDAAA